MTLNCEQIKKLVNPYEVLGNSDALAEHRDELNKLTPEEMHALAYRMVLTCPQQEMTTFGHAINALRTPAEKDSSFRPVLYVAYEVKKRILSLLDPLNKKPHDVFLDLEVEEGLFLIFNELALKLVETNETAIANRLALTTTKESRSILSRTISNLFPHSLFASKTASVFTLRRNIEQFLLSEKPEQFFSSREFNVDLCIEFPTLLSTLLEGHEEAIGEYLRKLNNHEIKSKIDMIVNGGDRENPFRMIAAAMVIKEEPEITISALPVEMPAKATQTNQNRLFHTKGGRYAQSPSEPVVHYRDISGLESDDDLDDDDVDDEIEDSCDRPFCGLFGS